MAKVSAKNTTTTAGEQEIDPKALAAGLEKHAKQIAWLNLDEGGLKRALADVPDTFADYYEAVERPEMPGESYYDVAISLALADMLAAPEKTTLKKLKATASPTVFYGDLHIEGDMSFDDFVIVLGDLTVDGMLIDGDEYAHLCVTGSLRAKAIRCQHTCWVGGKVETEAVVVGSEGKLGAFEGIHATLAIRDCFGDDGFKGTVTAKHFIDTEKDDKGLLILGPKYLEKEDDDHLRLNAATTLLGDVVKGKTVLR